MALVVYPVSWLCLCSQVTPLFSSGKMTLAQKRALPFPFTPSHSSHTLPCTHTHTLSHKCELDHSWSNLCVYGSIHVSVSDTCLLSWTNSAVVHIIRTCRPLLPEKKPWRHGEITPALCFSVWLVVALPASLYCIRFRERQPVGEIRGGKKGRGFLFTSSLLYLQPEAIALFSLWITWWMDIFPFISHQNTKLHQQHEWLCVCFGTRQQDNGEQIWTELVSFLWCGVCCLICKIAEKAPHTGTFSPETAASS